MRILIATGGSANSDLAVRLGAEIANATNSRVTILTVTKGASGQDLAQIILARALKLAPDVADVQTKVREGQPALEIVHEAQEGAYDLVIVGSRPDHSLIKRLLAPTAERVMSWAPCPVVIAKEKISPIRRVLFCDGAVETPSLLQRFARRLHALLDCITDITVLHVMSQISAGPGVSDWELQASAEELIQEHTPEGQLLEQDVTVLKRPDVRPRPKVRHGLVVDEILAEAADGDYDLIVIGAHGGEGWQRFLLDDLARQIVIGADRPVLIIN
jgi:nucleotide-binding universal stress UspA family protein